MEIKKTLLIEILINNARYLRIMQRGVHYSSFRGSDHSNLRQRDWHSLSDPCNSERNPLRTKWKRIFSSYICLKIPCFFFVNHFCYSLVKTILKQIFSYKLIRE
uniref:Uncharacterized protein n=1 Tax=Cacopsylla melanoneura TaxID=428564 RepID=A0A8D8S9E9_9HEMI